MDVPPEKTCKFTDEQTTFLIKTFAGMFYGATSKDRAALVSKIQVALAKIGPIVTHGDIIARFYYLRSYYFKLKRRMRYAWLAPKKKWRFYDDLEEIFDGPSASGIIQNESENIDISEAHRAFNKKQRLTIDNPKQTIVYATIKEQVNQYFTKNAFSTVLETKSLKNSPLIRPLQNQATLDTQNEQ